jgi:hypothetical protein
VPECHRCGRMQATAELRRTSLGFLCKDNGPGTRCSDLTRGRRLRERRRREDGLKPAGQLPIEEPT